MWHRLSLRCDRWWDDCHWIQAVLRGNVSLRICMVVTHITCWTVPTRRSITRAKTFGSLRTNTIKVLPTFDMGATVYKIRWLFRIAGVRRLVIPFKSLVSTWRRIVVLQYRCTWAWSLIFLLELVISDGNGKNSNEDVGINWALCSSWFRHRWKI